LKNRAYAARPVAEAELHQMHVFHPAHLARLTTAKTLHAHQQHVLQGQASRLGGGSEKYKVRLMAGGDAQDKALYDDLPSPTASTTSVTAA
jgi:hypothetical protein